MIHAINSNTILLSIDITRTHTQMKKSPRGEQASKKEKRGDRGKVEKRKTKEEIKEILNRKKEGRYQ